ncbi:MAG: RNA recognition motif domain-containing protein [Spirosomataceae bacterium]
MDIFVRSIPFKYKEKDLIALFTPYGDVAEAKIVIDKATRQNKGFGFVKMPNEMEALAAILALNGAEIGDRKLQVEVSAKPKVTKPGPFGNTAPKGAKGFMGKFGKGGIDLVEKPKRKTKKGVGRGTKY